MRLKLTLRQLEQLLWEQKKITIEYLAGNSYLFNTESTSGTQKPLSIDKEKMKEVGMKSPYPDDFKTLTRFIDDQEA